MTKNVFFFKFISIQSLPTSVHHLHQIQNFYRQQKKISFTQFTHQPFCGSWTWWARSEGHEMSASKLSQQALFTNYGLHNTRWGSVGAKLQFTHLFYSILAWIGMQNLALFTFFYLIKKNNVPRGRPKEIVVLSHPKDKWTTKKRS